MKKRVLMVIPVLLIGIIFITGCSLGGTKDDSKKYNININSEENIKANAYINYDKSELILYMTNNYSYNIGSYEVELIYYDKDGNVINSDDVYRFLGFKSGSDSALTFYLPTDKSTYESYVPDKIDLNIVIDQEFQEIVGEKPLYDDEIETSHKVNDQKVDITFKNNSGKTLAEIDAVVVFMKNNKPIAVKEIPLNKVSDSITDNVKIPNYYDEKKDDYLLIKYDSIKVVINRAIENY